MVSLVDICAACSVYSCLDIVYGVKSGETVLKRKKKNENNQSQYNKIYSILLAVRFVFYVMYYR